MNRRGGGPRIVRCAPLVAAVVWTALGARPLAAGEGSGLVLGPAASQAPALGSIAAGYAHNCAVRPDGKLACWGDNSHGQSAPPAGTFTQVSGGSLHTCGLRSEGTIACWGDNSHGQSAPPAGTFIQVSGGSLHTCGLRTDGTVACWGDNRDDQSTPLAGTFTMVYAGANHTCGLRTDGTLDCWGQKAYGQSTPPDGTFTEVAAGLHHTCGIRTDGTIACWGDNSYDQRTPPDGTFAQVTAGANHTCSLRTDGTLGCWGRNDHGERLPPAGTFTQVAAGAFHSCGRRTDGTIICWGANSAGQSTPPAGTFGRSLVSAGDAHACEVKADGTIACWGGNFNGQSTPTPGTYTQVAAGSYHACGLKSDGTAACWGANDYGQSKPPADTFTQVSGGGWHTCGLKTDGTLACWGDTSQGQSAPPDGTFTQVSACYRQTCGLKTDGTLACWGANNAGQSTPPADTFTQISAGSWHTCGLRTDGTLACWGSNSQGRGTPPAGTFTQVAAGGAHTCGLRTDGTLACWGDNSYGQTAPPAGTFSQVTAGVWFTCGRRTNGTTVCWGKNDYGQVAQVGFSSDFSGGAEPDSPASFEVVLTPASMKTVTVKYATADGTAKAGTDYAARAGTLTFLPGQRSRTISVPIVRDTAVEFNEYFTVALSAPAYAALGTTTHDYKILDDDGAGAIRLSAAAYSVSEAGPAVTVTAQRVGGSDGAVSVGYAASAGTATEQIDYFLNPSGTLSWESGDRADKTFTVSIIDDARDEPNETFHVTLAQPTGGAVLGSPARATVTIVDNDPAPTVRFDQAAASGTEGETVPVAVSLSAPSERVVTVRFSLQNGTAIAGRDFLAELNQGVVSFSAGETVRFIDVKYATDSADEADETFSVSLSNPVNAVLGTPSRHVSTILDDDEPPMARFASSLSSGAESSRPASIPVLLSPASGKTVTVKYATTNGTAVAGSDYGARAGTLTFPPGETTRTISVPIVNDTAKESNENFTVTLSAPVNATLGATTTHEFWILDEDTFGAIRLSAAAYSVGEAGPVATITAQRVGGSAGTVTVKYATSDGTATAGSDYADRAETLFWGIGDKASKTFTVPITNDVIDEPNETFQVALSPPGGGAVLGRPAQATVTIVDNDATPVVRFTSGSSWGPETTTPATLAVALSRPSSRTVTVRYTTANGTAVAVHDYAAVSGLLTFAPGEIEKAVAVRIFDDTVAEPKESFAVALSAPSGAVLGKPARHVYTIVSDDAAPAGVVVDAAMVADPPAPEPEAARHAKAVANDFDGDGRSDLAAYDPGTGEWSLRQSAEGDLAVLFGGAGAVPVTGDFDGDGRSDCGVFAPATSTWSLRQSSEEDATFQFGSAGALPVTGDFDGDGRDDLGVFDPGTGMWTLKRSVAGELAVRFGSAGSLPLTGDFDGDGRCDLAAFDPGTGLWSLRQSAAGDLTVQLGAAGSLPVVGDWDDDGRADTGVYDPVTGEWEIHFSAGGRRTETLGGKGSSPVVGDFDGDGAADVACYTPASADGGQSGIWRILLSSGGLREETFGGAGAMPSGGAPR